MHVFADLLLIILSQRCQFACTIFMLNAITETWLSPVVTDSEISIPNYLLYRRDRCSQNGGGVAIYVRTIFSSHLICTPTQFSHLELLIVSLKISDISLIVANFYRPPSLSEHVDDFVSVFSSLPSLPHVSFHDLILLGDYAEAEPGGIR